MLPAAATHDAQEDGRPPVLLRLVLPLVLAGIWFVVFAIGGMSFAKISDLASTDRSSFLPASAESTEVQDALPAFLGSDAIPAIVVVERTDGLTAQDRAALETLAAAAPDLVPGAASSPPIPAEDGDAAQIVVTIPSTLDAGEQVEALRAAAADALPPGAHAWVAGPAGFTADLQEAFAGIDGILLVVALAVVFVILVVVYRSPLLPVLVLLSSLTALCGAVLVNVSLARAGIVVINGQVQGILFILVIGAATDYSLLYIARYREALHAHRSPARATWAALRGVLEPIAASGGTVIAGLLCLLLSDLTSNAALGPVASIGIVCAVLTSLTFLPALLVLVGRAAFWPRIPRPGTTAVPGGAAPGPSPRLGPWDRVGGLVARAPRRLAAGVALLLAVGCIGLTQLHADGVPQSQFVLGASQARDGQAALDRHFPGGSGSPTYVLAPASARAEVAAAISGVTGVDADGGLALTAQDSPSGSLPVDASGNADPSTARGPFAGVEPTVVDSRLLFSVTLTAPADSLEAEQTVRELRAAVDPLGAEVGGSTAVDLDTNDTSVADRTLIIPVVLAAITLMLALLLRSVLAPLMLLATTVLSFGAALGVSAWIFTLIGQPDSDPSVPLYGFVFLVALGIDYNIFLMTRVREESLLHGTRTGVLRGLTITGGVITSAGVVLASTFAALAVIPIQFLLQLAIIVSLGVMMDALIVRTLLVPALTYALGDRVWWPARIARRR
ncbi:efflux RND transporter permease subunit [Brachybacterium huguangmaarense]|uniref:Efflux RND transporter permease subunit n=1 Tax=Brachybacterium huguangmaarense TaxID=1652028 RepID=A0ABY6G3W7_9MICO|nr:efflux RND transporter permease subunit [Brachybacterium huguangmaarense]UYG17913.1 efflux RND transporter permease subunit [Brachybacterium huguangmaarense]